MNYSAAQAAAAAAAEAAGGMKVMFNGSICDWRNNSAPGMVNMTNFTNCTKIEPEVETLPYKRVVIRSPPQCKLNCWKNNIIRGFKPCAGNPTFGRNVTSFHDHHLKTAAARHRIDSGACYEDLDSRVVFRFHTRNSKWNYTLENIITHGYENCSLGFLHSNEYSHHNVSYFEAGDSDNDSLTHFVNESRRSGPACYNVRRHDVSPDPHGDVPPHLNVSETEIVFFGLWACDAVPRQCYCDSLCNHFRHRDCCLSNQCWEQEPLSGGCSWEFSVEEKFNVCPVHLPMNASDIAAMIAAAEAEDAAVQSMNNGTNGSNATTSGPLAPPMKSGY